ncbi:hypothetical protein COCVIDRAFT_114773 [Bipolaris victoriae FI3]|uniref:Uncharacterized protein n=1 Tax=Bipolaris victoriae (strain FI3) TaxID=930091 RepID=W7DSF8_BIPV3|nr:hypothetical protein COCVIDRAFT_114773 [Bipolaris victoriae FI3]
MPINIVAVTNYFIAVSRKDGLLNLLVDLLCGVQSEITMIRDFDKGRALERCRVSELTGYAFLGVMPWGVDRNQRCCIGMGSLG